MTDTVTPTPEHARTKEAEIARKKAEAKRSITSAAHAVKASASDLADDTADAARDLSGQAIAASQDATHAVETHMGGMTQKVVRMIRSNPLGAVGGSALAGVIFGLALG